MKKKEEHDLIFVATNYFAGGDEKRSEILAQPEACCNCASCLCDCNVDCNCECEFFCELACSCGTSSVHMMGEVGLARISATASTKADMGTEHNAYKDGLASMGSTVGGTVGAGANYAYAQTVAYWGE